MGKRLISLTRATIDMHSTPFRFLFILIACAGVLMMRLFHPKHQNALGINHITIHAVSTVLFICSHKCEGQNEGPAYACNMRKFQQGLFEAFILVF